MFRILHVGLGPLGQKIISDLYARDLGEVVAAVDNAGEFQGRTVSDLVPQSGAPVPIQRTFESISDWSAFDAAIVTTSSDLARCAPTFRELLARGMNVVSTCEELCWPWLRHEKLAQELDALAKKHGGRLLGTGVNPGFLMDTFAVAATAISRSVRSVEVRRFQDASTRRIPFQKKIGVGLDDAQFAAQVKAGTLRHVGLGESLHFLAQQFGWRVERWEESIEPIKTDRDLDSVLGPVKQGKACGVRQQARGWSEGRIVITLEFRAALGLADPHDRVIVQGEPPIDLVWKGGVQGDIATSAIVLNTIAPLRAAAPGLHTMATIPLVGFAPGCKTVGAGV
ncbi:MAG: dihydrodipicolinate reductase [Planctomycetes bacterium]|nr:dihydrodipicolinate reductase [Planctomycetota bacterium]